MKIKRGDILGSDKLIEVIKPLRMRTVIKGRRTSNAQSDENALRHANALRQACNDSMPNSKAAKVQRILQIVVTPTTTPYRYYLPDTDE